MTQDFRHVIFYRALRDVQSLCDLLIALSLSNQFDDLNLSGAEGL